MSCGEALRGWAPTTHLWCVGQLRSGLVYVHHFHVVCIMTLTLSIRDDKALVKKFAKPHVLGDGLAIYRRLQLDDQDSVRLLTVEDLIAIAQSFSPAEVKEHLLKQIRQTVGDKSWRVRYMSASHFNEVGGITRIHGTATEIY